MDYAALKAAVNDWLARSDIADASADTFIDLAEARIRRSLRVRDMEVVYNELLAADSTTPCSLDILEFKHIFLVDEDDDGILTVDDDFTIDASALLVQAFTDTSRVIRLQWRSIDEMAEEYDRNRGGVPKYVTRYGDRLYFWPSNTDVQYTAVGICYQALTALSSSNTTNTLLQTSPDLYLAGTLHEAAVYAKSPDQAAFWNAKFGAALNEIQGVEDRQEFSGTPLTVRVRGLAP